MKCTVLQNETSWWLKQPIWKIIIKLGIFPRVGVKINKKWDRTTTQETWSDLPFVELLLGNETLLLCEGKKRIMLATATAPSSWKRMLLQDTCTIRGNLPPETNGSWNKNLSVYIYLHLEPERHFVWLEKALFCGVDTTVDTGCKPLGIPWNLGSSPVPGGNRIPLHGSGSPTNSTHK